MTARDGVGVLFSAARALARTLRAAQADPSWDAVLRTASREGVTYRGPSWAKELAALESALQDGVRQYPEQLSIAELRSVFVSPRGKCEKCPPADSGMECGTCLGSGIADSVLVECPACDGEPVRVVARADAEDFGLRVV